jgi:membrane protein
MKSRLMNVLRYVKESVFEDRLVVVAPGVAFFLMLGIMPALAALVLIYGVIADPMQVQEQFTKLRTAIPPDAAALLSAQMQRIADERTTAGWSALISIALTLWAGSYAMGVIVAALNIAFDTRETRGIIRLTVLRVALTLGAIAIGVAAVGMMVLVPLSLDALQLSDGIRAALLLTRWPLLLLIGIAGLAMLYRFGPDRERPRFRLLSWGSATAAILWVLASSLFSLYVTRFDVYHVLFGAFGAVVILMLWLLISAFAILLGAELDAAFERENESLRAGR